MTQPLSSTPSVFVTAIDWFVQLLTGSMSVAVAVVAVAWVGLALLQGRLEIRRGLRVVLGCFVLFSAAAMARGLLDAVQQGRPNAPSAPPVAMLPIPLRAASPQFDPYAGASVPQ